MQKMALPISRDLPPVLLYQDEIRALLAIWAQSDGMPVIQLGDQKLGSPNELDQLKGQSFENLSIGWGYGNLSPELIVEVFKRGTRIYSPNKTMADKGACAEAERILENNRSRNTKRAIWIGVPGVVLACIALGAVLLSGPDRPWWLIAPSVSLLLVSSGINAFQAWKTAPSKTVVDARPTRSTFWQRKGDDLWVTAFKIIGGGVVGYVFARFTK